MSESTKQNIPLERKLTEEEQAIEDQADRVRESKSWGKTVTLGAVIMYGAGLISTIALPKESNGWLAFMGFGALLFMYSLTIDMKTAKLRYELTKLVNSYKRKHAIPMFNRITEQLPDCHVHLADDGTIQVTQRKEPGNAEAPEKSGQ